MDTSAPVASTWKSSLLAQIGAVKAVVANTDRPGLKQYGAALMIAASLAIGGLAPATAHAAPAQSSTPVASAEFINGQPETSSIVDQFGKAPNWSSEIHSSKHQRMAAFEHLMKSSSELPLAGKIVAVNNFFNKKIAYLDDVHAWGANDYWATPLETLSNGAGDCEDFAIAKYFALERLGVPTDAMKITYVKSSTFTEAHMVLLVSREGREDPMVLDNMVDKVEPFSKRTDLSAVYSFNDQGLFMGSSGSAIAGVERIGKWQNVLNKVGTEVQALARSNAASPYSTEMMGTKSLAESTEFKIELPKEASPASKYDHSESSKPGFS